MQKVLTVENLHLFTGFLLVISGLLSYPTDGLNSLLSWCIFGAMYISMSDIGEKNMSDTDKKSSTHTIRVFAAYFGAILSLWLLLTFFL